MEKFRVFVYNSRPNKLEVKNIIYLKLSITMMKAIWRREVNIRAIGFSHDRPVQFVRSQWQKTAGVSIIYLVYRWVFALFFLSIWIWTFFAAAERNSETENYLSKWPIYLTNWGYTLCTIQALLAAGLLTHRLIREKATGFTEDHSHMPVLYKLYWILHTVAVVIAIGITGSYFVVEYNPAVHTLTALNLLIHAFNSILMVLDILIVDHPFRLLHICWPVLFIVVYFFFTVIYYFAGGTGRNHAPSIYPALDWRNVNKTLPIAILGILSVILAHFCIWLVVIVRKRIGGSESDSCNELKISKPAMNQVQPTNVVVVS